LCAFVVIQNCFRKKLKECEDRLLNVELTQDQIDFKDKLEAKYDELFNQLKFNVDLAIFESKSSFKDLLDKGQQKFDQDLKAKFNEACEQIKFDEIEYKKTITKKAERIFNRKNGHIDAKPQRSVAIHR
jgi:hypothetical protein